jgi:hypothetical protein
MHANGKRGLIRTIESVAKEFNGHELGNGRRLQLSASTLQRLWYGWNASGRNPSVFELSYTPNERRQVDPLLLRLLLEKALQTGAPLSEVVESLNAGGAKSSLSDVRRALPKLELLRFERSHRQLTEHRLKLEKDQIAAGRKWRRSLLKARTATIRKILQQDAVLERRILRNRDQLQRKFLQADARAVRTREQLQRKVLSRIGAK